MRTVATARLALLVLAPVLAITPQAGARAILTPVGTFDSPVDVTGAPGDPSRVYVVERTGRIRVVRDGVLVAKPFLDLTGAGPVLAGSERGLLSVAFPSDYQQSGRFYVYYTAEDPPGAVTIAEYRRSADPDVASATERILVQIPHDRQSNHNGGQLQVTPDGLLWAGTGDGGSGGDPSGNAQDTTSAPDVFGSGSDAVNHDARLGKLLRMSPAGTGSVTPSIFALGLRNPWRFSFDRATGDLYVADVGQGAWEEVDLVPQAFLAQGLNFGWNAFEGSGAYPGGAAVNAAFPSVHQPQLQFSHGDDWVAITGGYVVRDPALPELDGRYVYGDYSLGRIRAATPAGTALVDGGDVASLPKVPSLSSFGQDGSGHVYAVSLEGPVYRLASDAPPAAAGGGGGAGSGPNGAAGVDRRAPLLRVRIRARQHLHAGALRLAARCDEPCTLRVSGRLRPGVRRLRSARRPLAAGQRLTLKVALGARERRSAKRLLRRGRSVRAVLALTATDAAGNARRRTVTVRIVSA